MASRQQFNEAYRAVRLCLNGHHYSSAAALKTVDDDALALALKVKPAHVWRSGIECAKSARADGRSFRAAVAIHLQAVRYRRQTRYLPATKFPLAA